MANVNVAGHLARMAAADPDRPAIHFPRGGTAVTFRQLHEHTDALAAGLNAVGVGRGTRVALMVPPSPDFFALTFALLKAAAVPVLIDPGMGVKNLGVCLGEAEPEAFVGVPKAHLARRLLGWGRRTVRTTVNVGNWRFFCTRSSRELPLIPKAAAGYVPPNVDVEDAAAILFTSGSTGVAKGAVYTHGIFAAQVEMLKAEYGIAPGEVDLCTFPLFALFGPALGMTCVIPDMNFSRPAWIDPRRVAPDIARFGVTNFFGSPAVLKAFGVWGLQGWKKPRPAPAADADGVHRSGPPRFPTLKRVISAGAPATAVDLERFARLIPPGVEVFTPYGATEALPVANVGSREILRETRALTDRGHGICIGRPVAGMTVRVIRISDEAIAEWDESLCVPPGEVGEIVVRGPVVTRRYHNRDAATQLAKITDPTTGDVLHRMGDVGYFDDRGRLWFCGRKSHRVVTPEGTLFTDMVEPIFNALTYAVSRTALVGVGVPGTQYPVLCFEPGAWAKMGREAVAVLRAEAEKFAHTRRIDTFLQYDRLSFPVDVRHNSKIFREKLAAWAAQKLKARRRTTPGKGAA